MSPGPCLYCQNFAVLCFPGYVCSFVCGVCGCVYSTCMYVCVCVHAWSCVISFSARTLVVPNKTTLDIILYFVISFSAGTLCVPIKDHTWHLCLHKLLCILHAVCTAVGSCSLSWSLKYPRWQLKALQVFCTSGCRHLLYRLSEYQSVWTLGLLIIYSTEQLV